jgi:5,6,7,8-tetrahydromethanopterin hydro-lyase
VTFDLDAVDGLIGEAWAGEVPDGSHVNVVLARRGSPTAAAAVGALAQPRPGHAPLLVCLGAGNAVRPATIMTLKMPLETEAASRLAWGAAQIGIGQGVMDAVADDVLPADQAADMVLLAAVWVDPAAADATAVRVANRDAMRAAIADALARAPTTRVADLAGGRDTARNAFYDGE